MNTPVKDQLGMRSVVEGISTNNTNGADMKRPRLQIQQEMVAWWKNFYNQMALRDRNTNEMIIGEQSMGRGGWRRYLRDTHWTFKVYINGDLASALVTWARGHFHPRQASPNWNAAEWVVGQLLILKQQAVHELEKANQFEAGQSAYKTKKARAGQLSHYANMRAPWNTQLNAVKQALNTLSKDQTRPELATVATAQLL